MRAGAGGTDAPSAMRSALERSARPTSRKRPAIKSWPRRPPSAHGRGSNGQRPSRPSPRPTTRRATPETAEVVRARVKMHESWAAMHEARGARTSSAPEATANGPKPRRVRALSTSSSRWPPRSWYRRPSTAPRPARTRAPARRPRTSNASTPRKPSASAANASSRSASAPAACAVRPVSEKAYDASGRDRRPARGPPGWPPRRPTTARTWTARSPAICQALDEHGPTDRRELARLVGARYWGPGRFRAAVREAVGEGYARRVSGSTLAPAERHTE